MNKFKKVEVIKMNRTTVMFRDKHGGLVLVNPESVVAVVDIQSNGVMNIEMQDNATIKDIQEIAKNYEDVKVNIICE